MKAEIVKLRYLPTPRWTAAVAAAVVVVVSGSLFIAPPSDPAKYISMPNTAVGLVVGLAAMVFSVWMATLEFSSNTLQRTLTAEPDRNRVLAGKFLVTLAAVILAGAAIAAAAGGAASLAAAHAGVTIDHGDLASSLFGLIPEWTAYAIVGFGFGLLSRSLGGGLAATLAFVLALDGLIGYIPGVDAYSFGQLTQDLSAGITGAGHTQDGLAVAALGTLAWCAIIVIPGWVRCARGDLK